ncbi:splicing regulator RBM11 [Hylaeus anthracinus]|uniref:splicing regulator RBM11 n=1 Tax=Hylaeus volcanicus TaxID=313075 RepID=UPI0023B79F01|nr:splicing regulator RBM11 [Hylaeus volcanicus]XP_054010097.1 splicing regulator RBM11 [Hylaeus anthracinus]
MDEDVRTLWCGNLSEKVTEEILYELFLQGGPVQKVTIPKDRDGKQRTYGFVTYKHIDSVSYALNLFNGTMLFNRPLSMSTRNNIEVPQITNSQSHSLNLDHLLQLGQQMLVAHNAHIIDMFGVNMLPRSDSHSKHIDNVNSYKDDRRTRRPHPYNREQNKVDNHHKDHRPRHIHNNHHRNNFSRRDYKSNKRNYR